MPRNHARLLVSIWDDPDWTQLTASQQITYCALLSSRDLSWCGVAPLLPQRLARLCSDMTPKKAQANLTALQEARFLVIDDATAEVAVRSYVRHDDFLKQPNVVKAMVKDLAKVHSNSIRTTIVQELRRKHREEPDLTGWITISNMSPPLFEEVLANPLRRAS